MRVVERNRAIKKALARFFGRENISVKGDRGTAYGWVNIEVRARKLHSGECDWHCLLCRDAKDKIKEKVWQILKETGLDKELYTYYDDMGCQHKECSITVDLS
jgi:hypothetical protein